LLPTGTAAENIEVYARALTDYVEITNGFLDAGDGYWSTPGLACTYNSCRATFGTPDYPNEPRFLKVAKAYQDHVTLEPVAVTDAITGNPLDPECCF
ncbi:hypothetical protein, partial [Salmonella sp. M9-3]|uniref:hypothetical protein n=1 Tax=Salmonella sp. M9-3 TaxID=3240318 RepID=UPI00352BA47C